MTSLNFLLTPRSARELKAGDEVLVTRLDHDGNVAPWLALQEDLGIVVRQVDVHDDLSLDYDGLGRSSTIAPAWSRSRSRPTRSAPRPMCGGSSSSRTASARSPGPTPSTTARTARSTSTAWDVDVLLCSPYKFYGPHMGMAFGKKDLIGSWRPYKVRPAADEPVGHRYELGTCQHELLAGFVAAVDYIDSIGWEAMLAHERGLGQRFLDGLPEGVDLYGLPTMEGRVPTFCFNVPGRTSEEVATHLADEHEVAVWWGNYYALETMRAARPRRVDGRRPGRHRPLQHRGGGRPPPRRRGGAPVKILVLGGTQFVGRAFVEAALAAGDELTLFHRGRTNPGLFPEVEHVLGDRDGGLGGARRPQWDACIDVSGYVPRLVGDCRDCLRDRVDRYVYVSTISVYAGLAAPQDESGPLATLEDETTEEINGGTYGGAEGALRERRDGSLR